MWDVLLDLLGDILDLFTYFPGKPDYEDAKNPFWGFCGCFFYWLGILVFAVCAIIFIIKLIGLLV